MTIKKNLLGTWSLVRFCIYNVKGEIQAKHENWKGQLSYSAPNFMTALITKKEAPQNLDDIISYAGTFSVTEDAVTHHVRLAANPALLQDQKRFFRFESENELILKTPGNDKTYAEITWRRL